MILNVFFLCFLSFISHMLTGAGSVTSTNKANGTTAEAISKKVNSSSKHSYLSNSEKGSLEPVAEVPVQPHLKNVPEKSIDLNSILSEAALEAIGDAVMAEKLSGESKVATATLHSTNKLKSNITGNIAEKDTYVN